ncbi:MAG TPA: hypothetical protein VJT84_14155 [Gaiellaceae bacterium]|nr:hypothetical protein [Gaiellaceae bacterium]
MKRLAALLTWPQRRIQWLLGLVLSGVVAAFALVLRRGRHREWRREQERRAQDRLGSSK